MRIGFVGLGNVGSKLAASLQRQGFELAVRDLDRAAAGLLLEGGARWAASGIELAAGSDVVITCLPTPAASAEVVEAADGILAGLGPGQAWLEMSTTDAAEVRRLGALVEARGAAALDCPVSGGSHRAATGNIAILAGGPRPTFERVFPVLAAMGRDIVHTGPLGSASILKVITNYLAGVHLVATGEALMVAEQAGVDLAVAYEAIRVSSGNSFTHETEGQLILSGSYDVGFTMDHEVKDLALFDDLASRLGVPVELSPVAVDIVRDALRRYGPRAWSTMVVRRLEDDCGTELRAPGFPAHLVDDEPGRPGAEVTRRP